MDKLLEQLAENKATLAGIDDKLNALLANDELTAEQRAEHDKLVTDRQKAEAKRVRIKEAIARQEEADARDAEQLELERKAADRVPAQPKAGDNRKTQAAGAQVRRVDELGRPTAFFEETSETVTLTDEGHYAKAQLSYLENKKLNRNILKSSGYQPWGEFKSPQDFIRAGFNGTGQQKFEERVHRHYSAVQGMSEGAAQDGGYMVMPEFMGGVIDRIYTNTLWSRTDNYSVTGNNITFLANAETSRATGSRHGGLRGYYLAEGATATKSKPTLREVTLKLIKVGVLVYLTQELIDDGGSALPTYVRRKAGEEFVFMQGDGLFNGTGVGQPLGILNYPSLISIAKEAGQAANTLVLENFNKMYARFFMRNYPNAYWYSNQDTLPQLETVALNIGTGGQAMFVKGGGLSEAPYGAIKSRPLEFTEFNATLGTQGDLILADLGQTLSISKGGVAQAVSMHVEFLTQQLALLFTIRYNAGPWESSALTPFKGTNTQSSYITLDTRA